MQQRPLSAQNEALFEQVRRGMGVRMEMPVEILIAQGVVQLEDLLNAARAEGHRIAMSGSALEAKFQNKIG